MTGIDALGVYDRLDGRLLVLDPDVEPLFAEVDDILSEALAREPVSGWPKLRTRALRPSADGGRDRPTPRLTGRVPPNVRATQRGPPHLGRHRSAPQHPRDESEVMTQTKTPGRSAAARPAMSPDRAQSATARGSVFSQVTYSFPGRALATLGARPLHPTQCTT